MPYVPVAPPAAGGYRTALDLMANTDDQIVNTDDYLYRVDADPYVMGCDFGRQPMHTPTDTGLDVDLAGCEFVDRVPLTGSGSVNDDTGAFTLALRLPSGNLRYVRDGDGNRSVTGVFRGSRVRLREAA
ncbi:MAG TPA: hypothetical protein VH813_01360 [Candidatus Limnocylindrales bacterium]